jgi:hypothetical protein
MITEGLLVYQGLSIDERKQSLFLQVINLYGQFYPNVM